MQNKKALGVDFGLKKIGLSLSDDTQTIAFPFKYIHNDSLKGAIYKLKEIIDLENIGLIVVGMPIGLKGKQTKISINIDKFIKELKNAINGLGNETDDEKITITIYDERFSTLQAQKSLISQNVKRKKRKEIIDSVASALILQSYLDRNKN
ncbi:Holliday junction resolvase RuvX [Candidatus Acidulodesulfobacterium sp. H_13]|uniref:Holliday junction resolvase RuvX n=1 Tax=Candidatus Acidulodesulfobacterium sp. H_13 TaxID=3395470 RepID=UPI003AF5B0C8